MQSKSDKLKYFPFFSPRMNDVVFRGVSTPTTQIGWASGSKGTIIRTDNHGGTWEVISIPNTAELEFRDIKAFGDKVAYVMSSGTGNKSRVYKTTDAGKVWELQIQGHGSQDFFNCMAFWTAEHGMLFCDSVDGTFKIYITHNGGLSWLPSPESEMPASRLGEGGFAASGSCAKAKGTYGWFVTGSNNARVFYSSNYGNSWQVVESPIVHNTESSGIFSIDFSGLKGIIVGGDYKRPGNGGANIAVTQDGGITWTLSNVSPQYYWSAVAFSPNAEKLIVVGPEHCGVAKTVEPLRWSHSYKECNLNAVSFWSNKTALAVGSKGTIIEIDVSDENETGITLI